MATMIKLTERQDHFARLVAAGKKQSEAYREAYPASLKWKPDGVHSKASTLSADVRVKARIEALRAPALAEVQYDIVQAMREALRAYDLAERTEQVGPMVAAAQLRAKLSGLLIDRKEVAVTQFPGWDAGQKATSIQVLEAELARRALPEPDVVDVDVVPVQGTADDD